MRRHTLAHAIYSWKCDCTPAQIYESGCVICWKRCDGANADGDTCGKRCFAKLCAAQREAPEPDEAEYLAAVRGRKATV